MSKPLTPTYYGSTDNRGLLWLHIDVPSGRWASMTSSSHHREWGWLEGLHALRALHPSKASVFDDVRRDHRELLDALAKT